MSFSYRVVVHPNFDLETRAPTAVWDERCTFRFNVDREFNSADAIARIKGARSSLYSCPAAPRFDASYAR